MENYSSSLKACSQIALDLDLEIKMYKAYFADSAERYEDLIEIMKEVLNYTPEITMQQCCLLSIGYKNIVGKLRHSWRILHESDKNKEIIQKNIYSNL